MQVGTQTEMFDPYAPRRPGNPLFCHQDFLEKLEANRNSPVGKRAALLMQRLLVDERRLPYKGTAGVNRGWRRSRLGGSSGSHFYAWWAPKGAPPLKGTSDFEGAPERAIFLRDIRHHDDHSPLNPHSLEQNYLPFSARELHQDAYVPAPWTAAQSRFAQARQFVRIIKGYPGSGKTTALWHAAATAEAESVLYITYSAELAALARDHFDKFAPASKRFHVVTFAQLVRDILGSEVAVEPLARSRNRFVKQTGGMSPRILGPWLNSRGALYDEMHAHLAGAALPIAIGRFPASPQRHLSDRAYRERREPHIGKNAAAAVLETASSLRQRGERNLEEHFFSELALAWNAADALAGRRTAALENRGLLGFDAVALDEAQDLTPVETTVFAEMVCVLEAQRRRPIPVLVAGDEAQTVRPTDFEWGWFHDLVHHRIGTPAEFKLGANLRSPRRIAEIVNRVWDLYSHLSKQERPSGSGHTEIDEDASDQIVLCSALPGPELDLLLGALVEREGLAVITLSDEIPPYVPERFRDRILSVFEAKGLDFQAVCILDAGKYLDHVVRTTDRVNRETAIEDLSKRLAIDQLRVALSRPTDRLFWLDVSPNESVLRLSRQFLGSGLVAEAFAAVPAAVLKTLEEELLLPEERVRLCEADARQLLAVKPAMAWSRAQQAVSLVDFDMGRGIDATVRASAHLTAAEVGFRIAFEKAPLGSELGRPDLYAHAADHALMAHSPGLARIIRALSEFDRAGTDTRRIALIRAMSAIVTDRMEFPAWLAAELAPRVAGWMQSLEEQVTDATGANIMIALLPPLYDIFALPDKEQRVVRLRHKAVDVLMQNGLYQQALEILRALPDADPALVAGCQEGAGDFAGAAEQYLRAGQDKEALRAYRSIPDLDKALEMIGRLKSHPAAESLLWLRQMQQLAAERPAGFNRVMLPAEKKLLEELLESALGVSRKKPTRKAAAKKPAQPRKRAASPATARKTLK